MLDGSSGAAAGRDRPTRRAHLSSVAAQRRGLRQVLLLGCRLKPGGGGLALCSAAAPRHVRCVGVVPCGGRRVALQTAGSSR